MWPDRRLTELLGIEHPIVQAPMKGSSTPALAAAVSDAGGLGSLGCAYMAPEALAAEIAEMRRRTDAPFNLNFFACPAAEPDPAVVAGTAERLAPFYAERGLGTPPIRLDPVPAAFDETTVAVLLETPPAVVSFHFGLPPADALDRLRTAGCKVIASATCTAEARTLAAAGVDAIIAQGWEAGGHRGAFKTESADVGVGLMALVPQIADAVDVPVIAAGGIADGRGIAAALLLGASGVQLGTAFLACPESAASDLHRRALAEATDTATRLTLAHSGRPARARRTRYIDAMDAPEPLPGFPLMMQLSEPLRAAGDPTDPFGFQFLLFGQAAGLVRPLPAAELMARLVAETAAALDRGRGTA